MTGYDDFGERYYGQVFDEAMNETTYFKDDDLLEDFDDEEENER